MVVSGVNEFEAAEESSTSPPKESYAAAQEEHVVQCVALSGGLALGRPCFYRAPDCAVRPDACQPLPANEIRRVHQALVEVSRHCSQLAQQADSCLNQSAGDIFRAQSMLTSDPSLIDILKDRISASCASAESVVTETLDSFSSELLSAQSEAINERVFDIAELKYSLLACLGNSRQGFVSCQSSHYCRYGDCHNGTAHILIAVQFMPGVALSASRFTKGFLVEKGGPSSHAAILARMAGIPALSGISGVRDLLTDDCQILIDGDAGKLYINPGAETLEQMGRRLQAKPSKSILPVMSQPVNGFKVYADMDRLADLPRIEATRAEGVGLYRSETELLLSNSPLAESEQYDCYAKLLDSVAGPVRVRLLDLGADKIPKWLDVAAEVNPALGNRGARLLLQYPELLRPQARALARASQRRQLQVLYPMVEGVEQFLALRQVFAEMTSDISTSNLLHGAMFEVPSACLEADDLFQHVAFGSIGTNDLTQYVFANDRMNAGTTHSEYFNRTALWQLIERVAAAANAANKPVSLCGELLAQPKYVERILAAGIGEVNARPAYIPGLRKVARTLLA